MTLKRFIKDNRTELDTIIRVLIGPNCGTINDGERRLWILNNEGLYDWARSEGVEI